MLEIAQHRVAFDIGGRQSPEGFERALLAKEAYRETPMAFGYGQGVQKFPSPEFNSRFAGEAVVGGINGEFGSNANNKKNKNIQGALAQWAGQWASGPFGPGFGAVSPETEGNA